MKPIHMTILIFLAIILIVVGVFLLWHAVLSKTPNPPLPAGEISIGKNVFAVEMATTTAEQTRGLSGRANLNEGTGMFFIFTPGVQHFWMPNMNFPIDMIWIAGDRIAGFAEDAQPEPGVPLWKLKIYTSPDGVDKVLEVNAGTVAKDNIKVGDPVTFGPNTS
jgi:uncharacterized membrane protein (UPF0127 family)